MANVNRSGSGLNTPNIVMRSVFKYKCNGLNICLINAGSIFPKIDQFRRIFETSNAHLIIVTETWFKSYRSNVSIAVDDYDILRNDRHIRRRVEWLYTLEKVSRQRSFARQLDCYPSIFSSK